MNTQTVIILATCVAIVYAGEYTQRFLEQYNKVINPGNNYFSKEGVPYHTAETLVVESTDYGHETDSEAFSYNVWLKAMYGAIKGDFEPFNHAWEMIDKYMIPILQPNNDRYDPKNPGSVPGITVGQDPLFYELKEAYNTNDVYIMHWLSDVDNIYGFGNIQGECELGPSAEGPSFIALGQGSLWEGFNVPTCDNFKYGGKNGFQFTADKATKTWGYGAGPDADARAVQAAFWASRWAQGKGNITGISNTLSKASKLGDFLRYTFFDQHFKKAGDCVGKTECPGVTDKSSAHYLISWGIAWGGSLDTNGYSWRGGNSVCYYGYQNPVAAYAMINESTLRPKGATAIKDWAKSLERQIDLYEYLQTQQGAFAAGVTNSWNKNYDDPPEEYKTHSFHGMYFDYQPGYADANPWFGFQPWTADRLAQYYYLTGDGKAKVILEKWVEWVISEIHFNEDGDFTIPSNIRWQGLPPNTNLTVTSRGPNVGGASATARTLTYFAAASGNARAKNVAKKILDGLWKHHRTDKGVALTETMTSYINFNHKLYLPRANWTGTYPNGDIINSESTFLSVRSWFKSDPDWPKVQAYLDGGPAPKITVHRFWEQADVAIAMGAYGLLFE